MKFVDIGKVRVTLDELATAFVDLYVERLKNGMPQLNNPKDETVMEKTVRRYSIGEMDRVAAIAETKSKAFSDVIDAFHVVGGRHVPIRFYLIDDNCGELTITEDLHTLVTREGTDHILAEVDRKWSVLEQKWKRNRERYVVI